MLGIEGACDCESQCKDLTLNINRFAADAGGAVLPWSGQAWVDAIDLAFKGRDSATNLRIMRRHLTRVKNENSIFGPEWAFSPRRKKR